MDSRLQMLEELRDGLIERFRKERRGTSAANVSNELRAVLTEIEDLSGLPEDSKSDELKRKRAEKLARLAEAEERIDTAILDNARTRGDRTSG